MVIILAAMVPGRARGRCSPDGFAWGPKLHELRWRLAEEEEAVWNASVETQEYESCQQHDMGVDKEKLSFVPSAVSDTDEWHEPKFMCDTQ